MIMRRLPRWALLLAFGLQTLPARAQAPATAPPLKPPAATPAARVPFELLASKHMAVKVKINDKGPFRVIFDTGSPVMLLSNKAAQEAGLLTAEQAKGPALFGTRGQMTAKKLELGEQGELKAENISVVVMDHPTLKAAAKVLGPLDGIVGFPFFSRYRITLDYQAREMTFVPVEYQGSGNYMDMMMIMLMDSKPKAVKKIQSPTTVWGFLVNKNKSDEEAGVLVEQVFAGSAAAAAGLASGDRLLVLDAHWTDTVEDCFRAASGAAPGQPVRARIKRAGKEMEIEIRPRAGL